MADTTRLVNGEPALLPTLVADKVCGLLIVQATAPPCSLASAPGRARNRGPDDRRDAGVHAGRARRRCHPAERRGAAGYPRILTPTAARTADRRLDSILPYSREHYDIFFHEGGHATCSATSPATHPAGPQPERPLRRAVRLVAGIATRTTAEWLELCRELQIPASDVSTLDDLVADLPIVTHPVAGGYRQIPAAARFDGSNAGIRRHAALPGGDTREVLGELGLGSGEIDELIADGVASEPRR